LAIIPVDGRGAPINVGPVTENPLPNLLFAPDGTSALATSEALRKTIAFDMATGDVHDAPFLAINGSSWQPKAP
jgi:hypothetical protein